MTSVKPVKNTKAAVVAVPTPSKIKATVTKVAPTIKPPVEVSEAATPVPSVVPSAVPSPMVSRLDIAAMIRTKVQSEGFAVSEKLALALVKAFEVVTSETLASGRPVVLTGFGKFVVHLRSARKGRNPRTGEATEIAAKYIPSFRAGRAFKEAVNVGNSA